jgi:hypothetical protein
MKVLYKGYVTNTMGEPMGSNLHSRKKVVKIRTIEGESITRQYGKKSRQKVRYIHLTAQCR